MKFVRVRNGKNTMLINLNRVSIVERKEEMPWGGQDVVITNDRCDYECVSLDGKNGEFISSIYEVAPTRKM
jgi:hypothetical protein